MTSEEQVILEEGLGSSVEWVKIHGPSILSTGSFLLLLVWTQVAIPQQTPQSFCVYPSVISDTFVWLLAPLALLVIGINMYHTILRNRSMKGKEADWLPSSFTVISTVTVTLVTLATLMHGLSYKFIPITQREGWILHECNTLTMIRFALIYVLFLLNSFFPMHLYRSKPS